VVEELLGLGCAFLACITVQQTYMIPVIGQLLEQDLLHRIVPLHHLAVSTLTLVDAVSCLQALAEKGQGRPERLS
jgi:hypothetical protein